MAGRGRSARVEIGYKLSSEEFPPSALVPNARRAEDPPWWPLPGGPLNAELPLPAHFEFAATLVTEETIEGDPAAGCRSGARTKSLLGGRL